MAQGSSGSLSHRRSGTEKTQWEVTAFQAPANFEVLITGLGYTLRETVTVDATDGGVRMSITDVLLPTSLVGRLIVALSGGIVHRDLKARSARLKAQLEADESGQP